MIPSDYKTKKQAQVYSEYRFHKGLSQVNQDELNLLDKWLKQRDTEEKPTFADLGTGTGRVLSVLLKYNLNKIFAVDQSKAMLNQLAKNYIEQIKNGKIHLIVNDASQTGLKTGSIDLVTAFHLLKHLLNIAPTIKEVSRILKKDGHFIFEALNKNSIIRFNLGTCHATSKSEIEKVLSSNSLKIEKIAYLHPLGETVYNLPTPLIPFVSFAQKLIHALVPSVGTKIFIEAVKYG